MRRPDAPNPADEASEFVEAVWRCRQNVSFTRELAAVYARLDAHLAELGAVCWGGGACCRFDIAGHRLYVTTGELAYLLGDAPPPRPVAPGRCPCQIGPRCTARDRRPLGCRVYFCDKSVKVDLEVSYEDYHEQITGLHETAGVSYHYVELTAGLAATANRPSKLRKSAEQAKAHPDNKPNVI